MDRRYVGIDLHRRRSVIYAMDAAGERLFCERIANDPLRLLEVVSAGRARAPEVVIEATYGWYWAVDLLAECGVLGASGASVGQRLGEPASQERRTRRALIWPICCGSVGWRRRGSRRQRCAKHVSWCAIARSWCSCAVVSKRRCMR